MSKEGRRIETEAPSNQLFGSDTANEPAPSASKAVWPWLILLWTLAALVWEWRAEPPHLDDAYISYRYAKNLVAGHGLVFNPGEYVEGITNLLWTLLVAAGMAMGFDAPLVGAVLGFAAASATLVITFAWARSVLENDVLAAVAPCVVLCATPFVLWSTSGMETPLFAAAIAASLLAYSEERQGLAIGAAIVALLTRPDGILVMVVIGIHWLLRARGRGSIDWSGWHWFAVYALALTALTGFRLLYYGSPVPNTFYAKVGGVPLAQGVEYTLGFVTSGTGLLLPMGVYAAIRDERLRAAAGLAGLTMAYVICVGGDVFPDSRFFVSLLPILSVLGLRGTELAWRSDPRRGIVAASMLLMAMCLQALGAIGILLALGLAIVFAFAIALLRDRWAGAVVAFAAALAVAIPTTLYEGAALALHLPDNSRPARLEKSWSYWRKVVEGASRKAEIVNSLRPRPKLVAAVGIGVFGYYSDVPLIDLLGLVEPRIARAARDPDQESRERLLILPGHQRSNAEVIFERKPDFILVSKRGTSWELARLPAIVDIWNHPDFAEFYRWDFNLRAYRRMGALEQTLRRNRGAKK